MNPGFWSVDFSLVQDDRFLFAVAIRCSETGHVGGDRLFFGGVSAQVNELG
jgi:hypothetical protein